MVQDQFQIRCSAELRAKIKAAAARDRRSVSDWVRLTLEAAAELAEKRSGRRVRA